MTAEPSDAKGVLTPRYLLRTKMSAKLIRGLDRGSFLEVGCGTGNFLGQLARLGFQGMGLEISPNVHAVAQQRVGKLSPDITLASTYSEVGDSTFRYLLAFEVLQYIEDDIAALRSWDPWLEDGGRLIISVPANRDMWSPFDGAVGHLRRYDRDDVARMLAEAGFVAEKCWSFGFPLRLFTTRIRSRFEQRRDGRTRSDADHDKALESPLYASVQVRRGTGLVRVLVSAASLVFYWAGLPFRNTDLGDGYLVVARRADGR